MRAVVRFSVEETATVELRDSNRVEHVKGFAAVQIPLRGQ
jgi:hypothetical protein